VRIGSERYRVVGVMAAKGQFLGLDLDDAAYVPTERGLSLFNREGLMQIAVKFAPTADAVAVAQRVRDVMTARHGRLDVTVREQRQMLDVLDDALTAIALGAVAIGLLALVTGSLGVAAITAVAVRERTREVGLLRAIGATRRAIAAVFVIEAASIGAIGGIAGVVVGLGLAVLVQVAWPDVPLAADPLWSLLAFVFAAGIGAIAGAWPALSAAKLDPADALRAE
jgi:putative ABC transport system permease protein